MIKSNNTTAKQDNIGTEFSLHKYSDVVIKKCVTRAWNTKPRLVEIHVFRKSENTSAEVFLAAYAREFSNPHKLLMSFSRGCCTMPMLSKFTGASQLIRGLSYIASHVTSGEGGERVNRRKLSSVTQLRTAKIERDASP